MVTVCGKKVLVLWLFVCPTFEPSVEGKAAGAEKEDEERGDEERVGGFVDERGGFSEETEVGEGGVVGGAQGGDHGDGEGNRDESRGKPGNEANATDGLDPADEVSMEFGVF